jgi:hypothetical protein
MYSPFLSSGTSDSGASDGVVLNIAVACEDLSSGLRAEALFEQIKRGLGSDFEIQSSFWRFDEMEIPELRQRAETEFAEADMIVISYRTDEAGADLLPSHLQGILPQKGTQTRALVTLNRNASSSNPAAQYFREASAKAGIDFFSEAEWRKGNSLPQ